jgi:hypothetical protein
MTFC